MSAVAARGDAAELARFRRLVTLTIVATFALILIGGIVRVSDSGLGCGAAGSGTHGWPLCEGGVLPADSAESVIEFSHRVAATVVTVLIALLAWRACRRLRPHRLLVRGSVGAGRPRPRPGGARRAHGRERARGRARRRPPRRRDAAPRACSSSSAAAPSRPRPRRRVRARPAPARRSSPAGWCWRRSSPAATSPAPSTTAPPTSRSSARTRPAGPAGAPTSSRAATARARSRSASRGSPTSSSPTGCSCT